MYEVDTKQWASYWDTSRRTIQNWLRAEYPVTDKPAMAELIVSKSLGGAKCKAKAQRILLKEDGRLPSKNDGVEKLSSLGSGDAVSVGPGLDAFGDEGEIDLRQASAYAWRKMDDAAKIHDRGAISYWHERFLKNEEARRKAEIHAKKMGVDEGEVISRTDFSKWSYALAFWLVRSIEVDQRGLVQLVGRDELEMASLYDPIERFLMRSRFLKAFSKSMSEVSGVSLPKWFFEELNKGVEAFFECDRSDKDDVACFEEYQAALAKCLGEASHA